MTTLDAATGPLKFPGRLAAQAELIGWRSRGGPQDGGDPRLVFDHPDVPTVVVIVDGQRGWSGASSYVRLRTTSWDFDGERTDLHDCLGLFLGVMLAHVGEVSVRVWDEVRLFNCSEISAACLTLEQNSVLAGRADDAWLHSFGALLAGLLCSWASIAPRLFDGHADTRGGRRYRAESTSTWGRTIREAAGCNSSLATSTRRVNPHWSYFRDPDVGLSIARSPATAGAMRAVAAGRRTECIDVAGGSVLVSSHGSGFIDCDVRDRCARALRNIEPDGDHQFTWLENRWIGIGSDHLVWMRAECGRDQLRARMPQIQETHRALSRTLFSPKEFVWSFPLHPVRFERLIEELLDRQSGVLQVRPVSPTHEPDGGRDLMVRWVVPDGRIDALPELVNPNSCRDVVVQCKAVEGSIGKSRVRDIRDTVDLHQAQGYFLAMAGTPTRGLTEHLEGLRRLQGGRFFVNWWSRSEIERKLAEHPDLVQRFSDLVGVR